MNTLKIHQRGRRAVEAYMHFTTILMFYVSRDQTQTCYAKGETEVVGVRGGTIKFMSVP